MTGPSPDCTTAIVLIGGGTIDATSVGSLPEDCLVVAADSGVHVAEQLGLDVHVVIGDMDSIDATTLAALAALGTNVVRFPTDKNESDTELALRHAVGLGARHLIIVGGGGGRLDHQLASFSVMFLEVLRGVRVESRIAGSRAFAVLDDKPATIVCTPGDVIGLIPFGGDVHGVVTRGLQWALAGESLQVAASRGISNRAEGSEISVAVGAGRLIVTVDPTEPGEHST